MYILLFLKQDTCFSNSALVNIICVHTLPTKPHITIIWILSLCLLKLIFSYSYNKTQSRENISFTAWTLVYFQMRHVRPFPTISNMKIAKKRLQEITLVFSGNTCLARSTIILSGTVLINMESHKERKTWWYIMQWVRTGSQVGHKRLQWMGWHKTGDQSLVGFWRAQSSALYSWTAS